ncbi:FAD/NAD(P)-binding protein [Candidatus Calescamantes bacterium]|nr:FAD/NAD(P)-binding protein [Candidatus Calescamantes bacterium]MCK5600021.1 FAD/NAD(P)-binding protein [bacterium]
MDKREIRKSPYDIKQGKILDVKQMTEFEKSFKIALHGGDLLDHDPGQFVMVSIPGIGDAPISISSSPTQRGYFELVVRNVGKLTGALHKMEAGDTVGIRGPLGNGFPIRLLEGNDLMFVAGGLGIVPLRSLINYVNDNRRNFGKVSILLGCKSPTEMLFHEELSHWEERLDVNFSVTVDSAAPDWRGNVGMITSLIPGVTLDSKRTFAIVVGPPVMYKFVINELLAKNIPESQIYMSLERHMKCGVGVCGHCQIGDSYCCKDGPVFCYTKVKNNIEAL